MQSGDTIVAPATANGTSALAIIRASGPLVPTLIQHSFAGGNPERNPRFATYGKIEDAHGDVIDDGLLTFFPRNRSFTGEASCEFTCHGNPLLVQKILHRWIELGARLAEPGEFTRRAFLHGNIDLNQAEGVADLIRARSDAAIHSARKQIDGSLSKTLHAIRNQLLQLLAQLEAYLDFPDEDLPPEEVEGPRKSLVDMRNSVSRLAASHAARRVLDEGFLVVLAGPPNAGKSSILNALTQSDRAIVDSEAGTTRDYLDASVHWDGQLVTLRDTAGLRTGATSSAEKQGIQRTESQLERADLVLLVRDVSNPLPNIHTRALDGRETLHVGNKVDLCGALELASEEVLVSAETGKGLAELKETIIERAKAHWAQTTDDGLVVSARHAAALSAMGEALTEAANHLDDADPTLELAATALHHAREALAGLVGEIDHEEVLDALFGTFCIGK